MELIYLSCPFLLLTLAILLHPQSCLFGMERGLLGSCGQIKTDWGERLCF